jgi:hypothetical protein
VYTDTRGNIVSIPIRVGANETATIGVRNAIESGSGSDGDADTTRAIAVVHDRDGDGIIIPRINTYAANQRALGVDTAGSVFTIDDGMGVKIGDTNTSRSDDSIDVVLNEDTSISDSVNKTETDAESNAVFSSGQYELTVWNHTHATGNPSDRATLQLNPPAIERFQLYTVPAGIQTRTLAEIHNAIETNRMTSVETVAHGDTIVYELVASGLSGRLGGTETSRANAFRTLLSDPDDDAFRLSVVMHTDAKLSRENSTLDIRSDEHTWVVTDIANETYYLGMQVPSPIDQHPVSVRNTTESNGSVLASEHPKKELLATFSLHHRTTASNSTVQQIRTEVLPGQVQIDSGFSVLPAPQQLITGTATVAPGTQISIHLRSNNSRSAFNQTVIATVGSTHTWETLINASSMTPDTSFILQSVDTRPGIETIEGYAIGYVRSDAQSVATPVNTEARTGGGGGGGGRIASMISRLLGDNTDATKEQAESDKTTYSQSGTNRTTNETVEGNPQAVIGDFADAVLGTVLDNVVKSSLLGRLSRPAAIAVGALLTIAAVVLYRRQ